MSNILIVDDDPLLLNLLRHSLALDGHNILASPDPSSALDCIRKDVIDLLVTDFCLPTMDGLSLIREARSIHPAEERLKCILITAHGNPDVVLGALRERVNDFLVKPFTPNELRTAVSSLLACSRTPAIEVLSASLEWVHLRVPCSFEVVPVLQKLLAELRTDFPEETRQAIAYAFREMISNAIEYGGKSDPNRFASVTCIRLRRAILFCIRDPGEGFDTLALEHAAVSNPAENLLRHAEIRSKLGLRPGGFGILLTRHLIDELVYNERRNEVLFVKYL